LVAKIAEKVNAGSYKDVKMLSASQFLAYGVMLMEAG